MAHIYLFADLKIRIATQFLIFVVSKCDFKSLNLSQAPAFENINYTDLAMWHVWKATLIKTETSTVIIDRYYGNGRWLKWLLYLKTANYRKLEIRRQNITQKPKKSLCF